MSTSPHFINVFDPDVSGDIIGMLLVLLALAVAVGLLAASVPKLVKRH